MTRLSMLLTAGYLLLGAICVRAGMYGQPVINLDAKTFKAAMATEHAAMVAFVAPWCGHCKALAPEYTAAASSLSPLIPFYAVDCDEQSNKRLCAEYQIQGFPTIKAFPRAGKGAAKDYNGERKKGSLVEYAKSLVPDKVKKLRLDDGGAAESMLGKFLKEKPDLPHALLVHPSAPSIPFLWKVLAHRLSGKIQLGYVRDSATKSVLTSLRIYDPSDTTSDSTRCVVWQPGAATTDLVEHDGAMKFNGLLEFLQAQLSGGNGSVPKESKAQQKSASAEGVKSEETGSSADAAKRRKEKLEEMERRDQARRERMEKTKAQSQSTEEEASKVEGAPEAVPAGGVDEEVSAGQTDGEGAGSNQPAEPVPEEEAGGAVTEEAVEETSRVHEEL